MHAIYMRRIKRGRGGCSVAQEKRGNIQRGRERERELREKKKAVGSGIALEKSAEHPCLLGINSPYIFIFHFPSFIFLSFSLYSLSLSFIIIHAASLPISPSIFQEKKLPFFITYQTKMKKMNPNPNPHCLLSSLYSFSLSLSLFTSIYIHYKIFCFLFF